jgi:hypothetical protein
MLCPHCGEEIILSVFKPAKEGEFLPCYDSLADLPTPVAADGLPGIALKLEDFQWQLDSLGNPITTPGETECSSETDTDVSTPAVEQPDE